MAITRFNGGMTPTFSSMLEDFFNDGFFVDRRTTYNLPQVNVVETDDHFRIDVAAPGMDKDDFELKVEQNTLKVKAEKQHEEEDKEEKYTRREFTYGVFERTFSLPDSIDPHEIHAKYDKGILHITLAKKEEAKTKPPRLIEIQ